MRVRERFVLPSLALASALAWGATPAAPPPTAGNGNSVGNGRWEQLFQGQGAVGQRRCVGMTRGPGCITAASRKDAARRAAQARTQAQGAAAPAGANTGLGGNLQ
jgi:hypothetical protein